MKHSNLFEIQDETLYKMSRMSLVLSFLNSQGGGVLSRSKRLHGTTRIIITHKSTTNINILRLILKKLKKN